MNELIGEDWVGSPQKRAIDIVGATIISPVAIPAILGLAGVIRTVDNVDPFFNQTRDGADDTVFTIHKLRTMPHESADTISHGPGDNRASKLGKVLRRLHLDELPQGFNVILGEMSLVGPRPLIPAEIEMIMDNLSGVEQKDWKKAREICKPGIVDAFSLHARSTDYQVSTLARVESDIWYSQNASLKVDAKIMLSSIGIHPNLIQDEEAKPGYRHAAQLLASVAQGIGVEVNESEQEYWRVILGTARHIDDLVDEYCITDVEPILQDLIKGKADEPFDEQEAQDFSRIFAELSTERQDLILEVGKLMPQFVARRKLAFNANQVINIAIEEAGLFAKLLELDETTEPRAKFNDWVRRFAKVGYLVDAAVDLREDFNFGSIPLSPTTMNKARILRATSGDAIRGALSTPRGSIRKLAITALTNAKKS